jgi:hypothetical protein
MASGNEYLNLNGKTDDKFSVHWIVNYDKPKE